MAGAPTVLPVLEGGKRESAGPRWGCSTRSGAQAQGETVEEGGKGLKKISSAGLWPSVCRHTLAYEPMMGSCLHSC